jgi:hypothetical protein
MLEELQKLLAKRGIRFDYKDQRIMCFPHVINICCQHVIEKFTNIKLSESFDEFVAGELACRIQDQTFDDAIDRDPIALGRNIVRAIRNSGQRREAFQKHITEGNERKWFEVPQLQLLRDVKTRWDSVYSMISRLRALKPVRVQPYSILFMSHAYRNRP